MVDVISFKERNYPKFQSEGFASQFAIPYAKHVCKGKGVDIGAGKPEWAFPGSVPVDYSISYEFHAFELPDTDYDYIFSSHLLEHLKEVWDALDYWTSCLKSGGVMFLYLPYVIGDDEMINPYHLPWNNKKHKSIVRVEEVKKYFEDNGYKNIFYSGIDLNSSYMIFAEKI